MATTDKRQLRLTIEGILRGANIDDLALEARLTEAVLRFTDETKAGRDPVNVRKDILTGMLAYTQENQPFALMSERVEKSIHVTPDGSDKWNDVIRWLMKKDAAGEKIEKYAKFCEANPFSTPKAHQIAQNPNMIKVTWPGAFFKSEPHNPQSSEPPIVYSPNIIPAPTHMRPEY